MVIMELMGRRSTYGLLVLLITGMAISCGLVRGQRVYVEANGYTRGETIPVSGKRIYVESSEKAVNPLLEEEVAKKIKRALTLKGYSPVENLSEADYRLVYEYGIDKGQIITQTTGGSSPGTQLNIFSGQLETVQVTEVSTSSYTLFTRHLMLSLSPIQNLQSQPPKPLWVGEAVSRGSKNDLQNIIDFLIAASVNHLGQNTSHQVRWEYDANYSPLYPPPPSPSGQHDSP